MFIYLLFRQKKKPCQLFWQTLMHVSFDIASAKSLFRPAQLNLWKESSVTQALSTSCQITSCVCLSDKACVCVCACTLMGTWVSVVGRAFVLCAVLRVTALTLWRQPFLVALGPWDWQLSDRLSGTEFRGLLRRSVTSRECWRMATLGLSVLWQRDVFRRHLSLGARSMGEQQWGFCGGIRQNGRQIHCCLLVIAVLWNTGEGRSDEMGRMASFVIYLFSGDHSWRHTLVLQQIWKGSQFTVE